MQLSVILQQFFKKSDYFLNKCIACTQCFSRSADTTSYENVS